MIKLCLNTYTHNNKTFISLKAKSDNVLPDLSDLSDLAELPLVKNSNAPEFCTDSISS